MNRQEDWPPEKVKALRKFIGASQNHFAFVLNAEQKTISRWETGQRHPKGTNLRLLTLLAERVGFIYEHYQRSIDLAEQKT